MQGGRKLYGSRRDFTAGERRTEGFNISGLGMPSRFRIIMSRREFHHEYSGETGSVTEVFHTENPELFSGTVHGPGRKITPELFPFFPGFLFRIPVRCLYEKRGRPKSNPFRIYKTTKTFLSIFYSSIPLKFARSATTSSISEGV